MSTVEKATISVENLGYGRALVFDRPASGNAIDHDFLHQFHLELDAIERDDSARIVILRGRDGVFCIGRDLRQPDAQRPASEDLFARYMATLRRLATMPRIVIACVDGEVIAGGVGLLAASDLALATPRSRISLPEILWGLLPACVSPYLIRRVGFQHAYRMALTTQPIAAERAFEIGLIDELSEQPEPLIRQWALRLARIDTSAVRDLKRFYRDMWLIDEETDQLAVAEIRRLDARPEVKARIRSFVEQGMLERSVARSRPQRSSSSDAEPAPHSVPGARTAAAKTARAPAAGQAGTPVSVSKHNGIATVAMADRHSRNTFSPALTAGLRRAFADIHGDRSLKVVVIHGYDSYFCCGGTRDELLRIHSGQNVFTDGEMYDLLLRCELPVIAAMQGHALGGGLAMGAYADMLVMGRQCFYSTNFMQYGFTPGFGSTYIIPKRFGDVLGREMLFSAQRYSGAELQKRGANALIVDKRDVIPRAMELAREMAEKPRLALVTLKKHFVAAMEPHLVKTVQQELEMHEDTIRRPEARQRIEALFGNA
ncbi:MAG: polyketide synthase [Myxococcota bacterium]